MAMQSTVVSVYDTVSQADGFLVEVPENAWIQNRYFKSSPRTEFFSKKLILDFDSEDLKAGVWVRKGFVNGSTTHFRSTAVEPPRIGISDTIDPEDDDRQLFEQICYEMGDNGNDHVEALENLKRVKLMRLGHRVSRSIEKLCIQVLLDNAVRGTMAASSTDPTPVSVEIKYYDDSEGKGNPQRFIPAHAWSSDDATPYRDIVAMCIALKQHGGKAREVLMSPEAWICLRKDPLLEKYVSWYHSEGSSVGGGEDGDVERVARVVFDGFALDIIVYSGMYETTDGDDHVIEVPFLPRDFVCVLSQDCGRLFTAGCTMINPQSITAADPSQTKSFIPRRGKFIASQYVDLKDQELSLQMQSKPLPAPKKDWQWITGLMNNTNEVSEGAVGYAVDVDFALAHDEAGVTLPANLVNQIGGSAYTLTIPAATDSSKVVDVYLDGELIAENKAQSSTVSITLPNEDGLITLDYVAAG
jgi:hypothetical protein